jgi:sugar/nucleoside kinase (ribokinase family)
MANGAQVVDTTGCGTAFAAGFLTGVLEQWDDHRCMRFASAAAALTLTQFGSDMGFSCKDEVVKFMTTIPGAVD